MIFFKVYVPNNLNYLELKKSVFFTTKHQQTNKQNDNKSNKNFFDDLNVSSFSSIVIFFCTENGIVPTIDVKR
jgi:hypothetical protein